MSTQTLPAGTPWQRRRKADQDAVAAVLGEAVALRRALAQERRRRRAAEFALHLVRKGLDPDQAESQARELFG